MRPVVPTHAPGKLADAPRPTGFGVVRFEPAFGGLYIGESLHVIDVTELLGGVEVG